MPLITRRQDVLEHYAAAARRGWVLPAFNTENQTGLEAILGAALDTAAALGYPQLPIIVGLTNRYWHRPQAEFYTHTRNWKIGLKMFLDDVVTLTGPDSPFCELSVMVHLDHIQWDSDAELFEWDLTGRVSSIMYDASTLPFEENIARTAEFVKSHGDRFLVEGACDEIPEAADGGPVVLTTPDMAERYMQETGVDIIVANLGTEHRASAETLKYHGDVAKQIKHRIGPRICLHGTSSVVPEQVAHLFEDGICKVNIWTALERDSTPALLAEMLKNAAKLVGAKTARQWAGAGLLGAEADQQSAPALSHYTTTYRQDIVFAQMRGIVQSYLRLWYR